MLNFYRFHRGIATLALPLLLVAGSIAASAQAADVALRIIPDRVELSTSESRQQLVAQLKDETGFLAQAQTVAWSSSDEKVVVVQQGVARPVGNGKAVIRAKTSAPGYAAEIPVIVTGQDTPFHWSFRNHVESVLSKSGCNAGACHGARAGQKGFRLTLFGFDLQADYDYLTRQASGRRIVRSDPGRSLLLTKPTGLVPHKGGIRLDVDSLEYRVLAEWIAAGTPGPSASDPVIQRLEVLPHQSRQKKATQQQLVVLAHFSDGHVEDVTSWAKFTSLNTTVADVGGRGRVNIRDSGEAAIKVWYLNYNALAFLSVPYENEVAEDVYRRTPSRNYIDRIVLEKLRSLNLPPSPTADDLTFLRRVYLDTIGVLPSVEETRRFMSIDAPHKRDSLIEELLARPEFIDYWSYKWSDMLLVSGERLRPEAVKAYYGWIRQRVRENTPWDQFVRQLVTASGSTLENGAANFYALHQAPEEMAETVAQAFLGLSINCAKCHNHPLEKWTNDQYYGMANMFSRVRGKGWGGDFRSGDGNRIVFADTKGELLQPGRGKPQPPRPLDAKPMALDDPSDRRVYLAQWLTSPENPYFSRAIANRVWANFFGRGLVEKVDDLRVTNPASNEVLLNAVAQDLAAHNFDLRYLMRTILQSATYRRSSASVSGNEPDQRFYSRYYPRRLRAELLLDALADVTQVPTKFAGYPEGTRAQQLPDSSVDSYFLTTFGRPQRLITCDCERSDEPSMPQVLHLYNGKTLNGQLEAKDGRIAKDLANKKSDDQIIDQLYLAALNRLPGEQEKSRLLGIVAEAGNDPTKRRQAVEDLYWSVLSSREFLFNH